MTATYLIPAKVTYKYTVRFADDSTEPYNITVLPRKGQGEQEAVTALREILADNKSYLKSTPVLLILNGTSEEG